MRSPDTEHGWDRRPAGGLTAVAALRGAPEAPTSMVDASRGALRTVGGEGASPRRVAVEGGHHAFPLGSVVVRLAWMGLVLAGCGAPGEEGLGAQSSAALVAPGYRQEAELWGDKGDAPDGIGRTVAISGDLVVAGNDLFLPVAHVFRRTTAGWVEEADLSGVGSEPTDIFGHAVAIDGRTVVVGAPKDDENGVDSGAA
jgi:hypothetical protein